MPNFLSVSTWRRLPPRRRISGKGSGMGQTCPEGTRCAWVRLARMEWKKTLRTVLERDKVVKAWFQIPACTGVAVAPGTLTAPPPLFSSLLIVAACSPLGPLGLHPSLAALVASWDSAGLDSLGASLLLQLALLCCLRPTFSCSLDSCRGPSDAIEPLLRNAPLSTGLLSALTHLEPSCSGTTGMGGHFRALPLGLMPTIPPTRLGRRQPTLRRPWLGQELCCCSWEHRGCPLGTMPSW